MFDRELTPEEVEDLLAKPTNKGEFEVPGTNIRRKYNTDVRTITNWFKLPHTTGLCTVPAHIEHRPENDYPKDRIAMIMKIGRYQVCRWCFLEKLDQIPQGDIGDEYDGIAGV